MVKNASHTLAYSIVALQEMNLALKYPLIFWNCACLITDSGGNDQEEEVVDIYEPEYDDLTNGITYEDLPDRSGKIKKAASTDYTKIATAMGKMIQAGIDIEPPNINTSTYTFYPDAENNKIIFGLSGILSVGEEIIRDTIANRPYTSPRDYIEKVKPKKPAMISLIKGGAFDSMMDRRQCMAWYIWETCDSKKRLTLQNMPGLIKYGLVPEDNEKFIIARRIYEFNRYLKAITRADPAAYPGMFSLDGRAINFLNELGFDELIETDNLAWFIKTKTWDKIYQKYMDIFREWISNDKENIMQKLNDTIFLEDWNNYAEGSLSAWEMEALCFYQHEHELSEVNQDKYGFVDFNKLPEEPIVEKTFRKNGKEIPIFRLFKICGTCIAKNKAKATATILTTTGVVEVKFNKEFFSMYDKRISDYDENGDKKIKEHSWFNRGEKIVVIGMRRGDQFVAKRYSSTPGHTLYKILDVKDNGDLVLTNTRYKGAEEDD